MIKSESNNRGKKPAERQKMRPWLTDLLNKDETGGLCWDDKKRGTFRVSWKHGARNGWNLDKDATIFHLYAVHTNRYKEGENPDPKRWKANFRCALKSLDDVLEVGTNGRSKGNDAYRMFQFLDEKKKTMKSSKNPRSPARAFSFRVGFRSWSSDDSGVESPTTIKPKRKQRYSLRSRQKKTSWKKEADLSDSFSEATLDSPPITSPFEPASLPVPCKDSDEVIETRIKTAYTEQIGRTSGTFPSLGCGFVMTQFRESTPELPDQVTTYKIEEDSDSGESACSDEDTDEPMPPAYHCTPQHSVVTNAASNYFSVLDGGHTTVTDVNEVSRTFDTDGNLVIAAQVEITQQPTQSESSESESESGAVCSLNLPLPVIDVMKQPVCLSGK